MKHCTLVGVWDGKLVLNRHLRKLGQTAEAVLATRVVRYEPKKKEKKKGYDTFYEVRPAHPALVGAFILQGYSHFSPSQEFGRVPRGGGGGGERRGGFTEHGVEYLIDSIFFFPI